jgi:AcrR family transcriptional regulator
VDSRLLAVATELLDEEGWAALSLDRIAGSAGVSRATVWRAGLTRGAVERVLRANPAGQVGPGLGLRTRLAADCKDLMWRPLTMAGSGLDRLDAALRALCQVAERYLPLLVSGGYLARSGSV